MYKQLALFLGLLTIANAFSIAEKNDWAQYKVEHKKSYANDEEHDLRMNIFLRTRKKIAEHNKLFDEGLVTYEMGLNEFSDMTFEEFSATYLGYKPAANFRFNATLNYFEGSHNTPAKKSVDWRQESAVTEVKYQGSCGACWAFSATGAIEGQNKIKHRKLVSLSEQNLIDCTYENNGCGIGTMNDAFQYVHNNGGINTEKTYKYESAGDTADTQPRRCRYNSRNSAAYVSGYRVIRQGNEAELQQAISTVGPISVAFNAPESMKDYKRGLYFDESCDLEMLDHAAVAVGYNEDPAGKYYIVKNSWGITWGENGYIRMARDQNDNCGIAQAAISIEEKNDWEQYKVEHSKSYANDEEHDLRMKIFLQRRKKIAEHNKLFDDGLVTFTMGLNEFSDMTFEEFKAKMHKCRRAPKFLLNKNATRNYFKGSPDFQANDNVDWTKPPKIAVTEVKNQGKCGSCWAFASVGAIESQLYLKTGKLVSLSAQFLVDCDRDQAHDNDGCNGGNADGAFQYVHGVGGIPTEASYPYVSKYDDDYCPRRECKKNPANFAATVSSYVDIKSGDERKLQEAIKTIGPIAVAIHATDIFTHYTGGYYIEPGCPSDADSLDHVVLVVGYGEENGKKYYLVKNTYGQKWGEKGFIRMARDSKNHCGIATEAVYPVVNGK
ncbi:trophozoite cysteine proteinase-like [Sitodiplosis mosellana]|uniref:trophozoite cysteine proteinase-like n=1 Tax=Sitodiplosis mosellana TaxID=263140 RepID=UPI002443F0DD|nr:trophozoite cysteine proteinase-like [Sitodiplosis mosellana]